MGMPKFDLIIIICNRTLTIAFNRHGNGTKLIVWKMNCDFWVLFRFPHSLKIRSYSISALSENPIQHDRAWNMELGAYLQMKDESKERKINVNSKGSVKNSSEMWLVRKKSHGIIRIVRLFVSFIYFFSFFGCCKKFKAFEIKPANQSSDNWLSLREIFFFRE